MAKTLTKYSVRLYEEDMEIIKSHYPDFGYNQILRHMTTKLADRIRQGRDNAISGIDIEEKE